MAPLHALSGIELAVDHWRLVLVLYLKRPRTGAGSGDAVKRRFGYSDLKEAAPGGLWDLYLEESVLVVCEFAFAVSALGFE